MPQEILTHKFIISAGIIILIIFLHYLTILSPLENIISLALSPFQSLIYSASDKTSNEISKISTRKNLILENQACKDKINKLEQKIVELQIFVEENNLLMQQNEYLKSQGFNFINTQVVSSASQTNPNLLIINQGEKEGIRVGMAGVVENGTLIGKVIKTESRKSYLLLLIDSQSKISAAVAGQSEIAGVVEGEYNISLNLNYVLKNTPLKKDDLIMTSGFDEHVPAGLLIGQVDEITDQSNDLFKSAKIISPVNFKNLRIVSIILQ